MEFCKSVRVVGWSLRDSQSVPLGALDEFNQVLFPLNLGWLRLPYSSSIELLLVFTLVHFLVNSGIFPVGVTVAGGFQGVGHRV